MRIEGEVGKVESIGGDEVRVTVINLSRFKQARWRDRASSIPLEMTILQSKAYPIGRKVRFEVQPQ